MKDIFCMQRFGLLWRSYWVERWQELACLLAAGALLNIIFCVFFIATGANSFVVFQHDAQAVWFVITWFITGSVFTGLYVRTLSNTGASLIFLLRPASHVEKTLLAFIVVGVVFPLAFTLALTLLNLPFITLAQSLYKPCEDCANEYAQFKSFIPFISSMQPHYTTGIDTARLRFQYSTLSIYWCIQGFIVGGFLYFRRFPLLAITVAGFLIFFAAVVLNAMPASSPFWQLEEPQFSHYSQEAILLSLAQWLLLPMALWLTVYFHLKERQI